MHRDMFSCAMLLSFCVLGTAEGGLLFSSDPGLNGLGAYQGEMRWIHSGGSSGLLEITLANGSPAANGGALTGFAFNVVDGVTVAYSSGLADWQGLALIDAAPYDFFDFGAAIGGNFLGGNPQSGLRVGESATFAFTVTGAESLLAGLSDASFFDASGGVGFIARFRGFDDGGSDKVTASAVPAPGALALLALTTLKTRRRRG
jgi:hypothetical protein